MAKICHEKGCGRVHPRGVVSCARAKELIEKSVAEFRKKVAAHRRSCHGCPDVQQHVLNLEDLAYPIPPSARRVR